MGTGLGVDPTKDGTGAITSGMSSQDHRKVLGSLYSPGIISGATVATSPSAMTYTVSAGVASIKTATGQAVLAPIPQQTVNALPAPGSGSARVDIVFAKQRFPVDGDSNVIIDVATVLPANALELGRFSVGVGITKTDAAVRTGQVDYSIPYGANLGVLHEFVNTYSGAMSIPLIREGHGTISLPTDRRVKFSITATMYAIGANGFDNSKYTEHFFLPNIDGGDMVIFCTPGLHQAWATYKWEHYFNLAAGTHTVMYGSGRMVGPGQAATHYGTDGAGFGRTGVIFRVEDAGVLI